MIAPAPTDPDRAAKLDEQAYRTLFERLGAARRNARARLRHRP